MGFIVYSETFVLEKKKKNGGHYHPLGKFLKGILTPYLRF